VGLEGLECRFPSNREVGKHRLWFHKQNKFQDRVNTEDEMLAQLYYFNIKLFRNFS
jgi:hypothetical protein